MSNFTEDELQRTEAYLTAGQRLGLLRQLADALRYAQGHRIIHRGLAPQSVLVTRPDSDAPAVKVFNWQVGVRDSETASMWQSLGFGPNYKAAYCMAVCPAGDDVIGPYLDDRKGFLKTVVDPLQKKVETLYVVPGSDAQAYADRRYPHKRIKPVGNGLRPGSIRGFLSNMPHVFQRHQSAGLTATYHFTFTGQEPAIAKPELRSAARGREAANPVRKRRRLAHAGPL